MVVVSALLLALVYLYRINRAMMTVPAMAEKLSHRWSRDELAATHERVKENPINLVDQLPPRLTRRYIVVGGSGMKITPAEPRLSCCLWQDRHNMPSHTDRDE